VPSILATAEEAAAAFARHVVVVFANSCLPSLRLRHPPYQADADVIIKAQLQHPGSGS
jgi:hypothetical protein